MRVTNKLLINNFMRNLNYNLNRMKAAQYKLSSGHQIEVASDDPVGAAMIMKLKSDIAELKHYNKNIEDARSILEYSETSIVNIEEALGRIREIVIHGANSSLTNDDRTSLAYEVEELKANILQEANANYAGKYIFGGFKTDNPPYEMDAMGNVTYNGDDGVIKYEISPGTKIQVNLTGNELFKTDTTTGTDVSIFDFIDTVYDDLVNGNITQLSGSDLEDLDCFIDNTLRCRAKIGAKVKRLENTKKAYDADEINLTKLLAKSEDADLAQVVMELTNQESVYRAALSAGSRIIQPTLADFLR